MTILRNDIGEIRLLWKLILIILLFVAVAVLLRLIPILIYTAIMVNEGIVQANALEKASSIILEGTFWSIAIGILSGLIGLLIVWFMIRVVEKFKFTWKTVGLDLRRNTLFLILIGAIMALLLCVAYILTSYVRNDEGSSVNGILTGIHIPIIFQNFILYLAMGFGEEVVFRGYIQTRMTERYRAIWGILITAVVFVLLHQISYGLSPIIIISGVLLWTTIGALYYLSKSLYLVVIFHGLMNTLINSFHLDFGDVNSMIVHAIALLLIVVVVIIRLKVTDYHSKPV